MRTRWVAALLLALAVLAGCTQDLDVRDEGLGERTGAADLTIVSGSENETLEPIIQRFAEDRGASITMEYRGSVDIMLGLQSGEFPYDAVWPANSLWVDLGDEQGLVRSSESIMRSPIVFGVKRPVAEELGWVDAEVRVADIVAAAESGQLNFMMTSATQSNSGASAYLGFLSALAGSADVLTDTDLQDPAVTEPVTRLLGSIDRSSGSSGWLKDLFLDRYDDFDAMVNYESVIIEANQQLVNEGREPLYAIYPVDGLAVADSPLGFVDRGEGEDDDAKAALFDDLQAYLLSEDVQQEILGLGRRVGAVGLTPDTIDTGVFNPEWGIDVERVLSPIRFPEAAVIRQALDLYQTSFRKPSFTIFCVDFSGSMEGPGEQQLTEALRVLLDQDEARRNLLQGAPDDITVVIPFNHESFPPIEARGNDPASLTTLFQQVEALQVGGDTNIYDPVIDGLEILEREGVEGHFPAIILMTDGEANAGSYEALEEAFAASPLGNDVPVYGILFGNASEGQVDQIAELTSGRVFDGREDLVSAFRTAKGYN